MANWEEKVWGRRRQLLKENCVEVWELDLQLSDGKPVCCSSHDHDMKFNKFYVVEGKVGVQIGGESRILSTGDEQTVHPHVKHRFTVLAPSRVIEFTWAREITEDINRDDVGHVLEAE